MKPGYNSVNQLQGVTAMVKIPTEFYSKEITHYINQLASDDISTFDELCDSEQSHLISLGLKAFGNDIDLVLSRDATALLSKYLVTHDRDDQIEFIEAARACAIDEFYPHFDQLISNAHENYRADEEDDY